MRKGKRDKQKKKKMERKKLRHKTKKRRETLRPHLVSSLPIDELVADTKLQSLGESSLAGPIL